MNYVMSDIHGHYDEYLRLLKQIGFRDSDNLYVLGGVVGRSTDTFKLLDDMMMRVNVFPLLGNHDYMAMKILLAASGQKGSGSKAEEERLLKWVKSEGAAFAREAVSMGEDEREGFLDYLEDFMLTATVSAGSKNYVLVHAGLDHFDEKRSLDDYHYNELIYHHPDYSRVYYRDKYLVTGHYPTFKIDEKYRGEIVEMNNHIAIDCGARHGVRLGAYCLDTGDKFYVDIEK